MSASTAPGHRLADELALLIKSRYPLVYLESTDEDYAVARLKEIAARLGLVFYHWSVTEGLRRGDNAGGFYQTQAPDRMF